MSRLERHGTRDFTYSAWHRLQDDSLGMIDLDGVEYDRNGWRAVALLEVARDVGQTFKSSVVTERIAKRAGIRAFQVFYTRGPSALPPSPVPAVTDPDGLITSFRVLQTWPARDEWAFTPAEFVRFLHGLRERPAGEERWIGSVLRGYAFRAENGDDPARLLDEIAAWCMKERTRL